MDILSDKKICPSGTVKYASALSMRLPRKDKSVGPKTTAFYNILRPSVVRVGLEMLWTKGKILITWDRRGSRGNLAKSNTAYIMIVSTNHI